MGELLLLPGGRQAGRNRVGAAVGVRARHERRDVRVAPRLNLLQNVFRQHERGLVAQLAHAGAALGEPRQRARVVGETQLAAARARQLGELPCRFTLKVPVETYSAPPPLGVFARSAHGRFDEEREVGSGGTRRVNLGADRAHTGGRFDVTTSACWRNKEGIEGRLW